METVSENRRINKRSGQVAGRTRSAERSKKLTANGNFTDGFLNHQFLPLLDTPAVAEKNPDSFQKDFFKSLRNFTNSHHLTFKDFGNYPYPYNVAYGFWFAYGQMDTDGVDFELDILPNSPVLSSTLKYDCSYTVYIISVLPLYRLTLNPKKKKVVDLICSVYSYLYHVAQIPYYRSESTSLYNYYEFKLECEEESWDYGEDINIRQIRSYHRQLKYVGDEIERILVNPCHLREFSHRVAGFFPETPQQTDLLNIARCFLTLLTQFPNRTIFDHMSVENYDDDRYDEWITADEFISFVFRDDDLIFQDMMQALGENYGAYGNSEQPLIRQFYDCETEPSNLCFERRILPLFGALNNLKMELL